MVKNITLFQKIIVKNWGFVPCESDVSKKHLARKHIVIRHKINTALWKRIVSFKNQSIKYYYFILRI